MKESLKIDLFIILTLLLHSFSNKAMAEDGKVTLPIYRQNKCYISQEQPDNNMLAHIFHLHATPFCDMSHADGLHVPGNKLQSFSYSWPFTRG